VDIGLVKGAASEREKFARAQNVRELTLPRVCGGSTSDSSDE
jgi:hypothetical protein